jgi:hypothetical protein
MRPPFADLRVLWATRGKRARRPRMGMLPPEVSTPAPVVPQSAELAATPTKRVDRRNCPHAKCLLRR